MPTFGRTSILTDYKYIDATNIVEILQLALSTHNINAKEIQHLIDVYKGKQSILNRVKVVRPEINNTVVLNHANEIVSFKVSYLLSEPIEYVGRGDSTAANEINKLNEYMYLECKAAKDKEIADNFTICGVAYRMVLPNENGNDDEAPFNIYTLDPRDAFIVYNSGVDKEPLCGVLRTKKSNGIIVYTVYTKDTYFNIENNEIVNQLPHSLCCVPIFEYVNNTAKIGAFEVVETLIDAINKLASNRIDATEQTVQALMVFTNCDISADDYDKLREQGAIKIKSDAGQPSNIELISVDLKQADQQVLMDSLYSEVLRITGMPMQATEGTSDSSNNGAMIVKNGWYHSEARAKDTELLWRQSENKFLKLVLKICRERGGMNLSLGSITEKFTRRNYENIMQKAQVLDLLLKNPDIHPQLAFSHSGMFVDSEMAYTMSREWSEQNKPVEREVTQNVNTGADTVTQ